MSEMVVETGFFWADLHCQVIAGLLRQASDVHGKSKPYFLLCKSDVSVPRVKQHVRHPW